MDHKFCPTCNYAVDPLIIEQARFPWAMRCPRCETSPLPLFYTIGSKRHELQVEDWKSHRGHPLSLAPAPLLSTVAAPAMGG